MKKYAAPAEPINPAGALVCNGDTRSADYENIVVDQIFVMESGDNYKPADDTSYCSDEKQIDELKALYETYLMRELKGRKLLIITAIFHTE